MKRRFSLLFAIVLLLSIPFLVSGLTPEKPYPDLADGDQLTATWLMGTFNTIYSWAQGTNATVTAHIATYTPHARMDGARINTPIITGGTASGTALTNCSIAGLSLSGTTINNGTMSGGTVTGSTVTSSTLGSTNSIDGGAVKSGTVADARIDSALARDSEVTTAVTNHNNVTNPHGATNANTANRIVMRDAFGNFSAGTITANVTGNVTGNTSGSSGSCTGNSATATKLASARTLNIQDADGSNTGTGASFDGSGNATVKLPATIKASITGNVSGTAANVTGTVADANIASTIARDSEVSSAVSAALSTCNASYTLTLLLDGSRKSTGFQRWNGNYGVAQSTNDGADTGYILGSGGGYTSGNLYDRGSAWILYGNEYTTIGGQARYYAGNVSTGDHIFYTGNGTERMRLTYGGNLGIGTDAPGEILSVSGTNVKPVIGKNSHTVLYPGYDSQNITALEIHANGTGTTLSNLVLSNSTTSGYGGSLVFATTGTAGTNKRYSAISGNPESDSSVSTTGMLQFSTSNAGTLSERMRITANGNVLIGTTTNDGTNKLQVNGTIKSSGLVLGDANAVYWGAGTYVQGNNTAGTLNLYGTTINFQGAIKNFGNTVWHAGNDGSGSGLDADTLDTKHASDFATAAQGTKADNALPSSSYTAADVLTKIKTVDGSGSGLDADTVDGYAPSTTSSSGTLVLRGSYGEVFGKADSGSSRAGVEGNGVSGNTGVLGYTGSGIGVDGSASNFTGSIGVRGRSANASGYDFYASGAGVDYGTSSSIRWKKNRKPIQNALGIVNELDGLRFTWDKDHGGLPGVGFIAEEVGKYLPEIVVWDAKAPGYADGMDYSKMTPLLLQAIKELDKLRTSDNAALLRKIEKQEKRINELEAAIKAIQAKLH